MTTSSMASASFVSPPFLREVGPAGLTRQVERLLLHLGFEDVANIDGPNDEGGDLIGVRDGLTWVFQVKWKSSGTVPPSAIDEATRAKAHYGTDRAAVVTNSRFSRDTVRYRSDLLSVGVRIELWSGTELLDLFSDTSLMNSRLPTRELRPYQVKAFQKVHSDLESTDRALLILATGLGKTVIGGEVIARYLIRDNDMPILVLAHTKELVEQLERALWRHVPKEVRTEVLTGERKLDDLRGITCATVGTALNYVRGGFKPKLVMVDEAHHVAEDGAFAEILERLAQVPQFGVTATPWRGDEFDIQRRFGPSSFSLGIEDGMRLGYLSDVKYKLYADNIDWDFVRAASKYQYTTRDLNSKLFLPERDEGVRDRLLETWERVTSPRAVIFCRTVEHAERMAALMNEVPQWTGSSAIHAELPKRERQMRMMKFRSGEIPLITAVDILNEGVDVPDLNILCFARVTHSRRIFVQQLGRGLRLKEGKAHVEVLDFVSDIRRVAAVMRLKDQVRSSEVETLSFEDSQRTQFEFSDQNAENLMKEWIQDAASLETALDEARLQFPEVEVG